MQASQIYSIIGLGIFSYLCGSIPFGYLFGRLKGVDLREHGSKNIGATNAGRVLGKKYFVLVFLLDAFKGFFAAFVGGWYLFRVAGTGHWMNLIWLLIAFCAIAGHNWPCWLGFRGGKGVSTSLGMVLAIYPYYTYPGIAAFLIWLVVVKLTRYVSLASILAAGVFLLCYGVLIFFRWSLADQWPLLVFAALMLGLLVSRHWTNIQRLRAGTEHKFSLQKNDPRTTLSHQPK